MKSALRLLALLGLIALVCGLTVGCAREPVSDKHYTLEQATALESTAKAPDVMAAYAAVKRDFSEPGKDQGVAAEAEWRAAQYAASDRYGAVEIKDKRAEIHVDEGAKIPESLQQLMDQMRSEGDYKAHDAVKQLLKEFPQSAEATLARQQNFQKALEDRIDKRNSANVSYKIVASLVNLTGRVPGFSYWFALVMIAVLVKLITLPLMLKTYRSQREMQRIQPFVKEIQEKYKGNPQEMNEKMMACYKEHGVNPFATCLPMLVQFPFMIWVYSAIRQYEYHFSNGTFLWIGSPLSFRYSDFLAIDLAHFDVILLVVYAISNYLTMKLTPQPDPQQAAQQKMMSVWMTGIMFWTCWTWRWSAAFIFYWLILNLISAWQSYVLIYKKLKTSPTGGSLTGAVALAGDGPAKSVPTTTNGTGGSRPQSASASNGNAARPRPRKKRK